MCGAGLEVVTRVEKKKKKGWYRGHLHKPCDAVHILHVPATPSKSLTRHFRANSVHIRHSGPHPPRSCHQTPGLEIVDIHDLCENRGHPRFSISDILAGRGRFASASRIPGLELVQP